MPRASRMDLPETSWQQKHWQALRGPGIPRHLTHILCHRYHCLEPDVPEDIHVIADLDSFKRRLETRFFTNI